MERFTISLSDTLAAEFDQWLHAKGYTNRSEGVRDLLRQEITKEQILHNQAKYSVATLSFIYNHHERMLSERLISLQHQAHHLVICSSHVHLNHEDCMECLFLQGSTATLQQFASNVAAESGVRHSMLNLIPVELNSNNKDHPAKEHFQLHPVN